MEWADIGQAIVAIGAFGGAATTLTQTIFKGLSLSYQPVKYVQRGDRYDYGGRSGWFGRGVCALWRLPYAGFGRIEQLVRPMQDALQLAYGPDFLSVIAQQYRNGRSAGDAPETIGQGVRLALPLMVDAKPLAGDATELASPRDGERKACKDRAAQLIFDLWGMDAKASNRLANILAADRENTSSDSEDGGEDGAASALLDAQSLVSQFILALENRIDAAFQIAEIRYAGAVQTTAGVIAVALAVGLECYSPIFGHVQSGGEIKPNYVIAVGVGLLAVPLAPIAHDLAKAVTETAKSWRGLAALRKP
ncbi:MAG: hypothetical protein ACFB2Z_06405 [Maricaulaceae bacterium]